MLEQYAIVPVEKQATIPWHAHAQQESPQQHAQEYGTHLLRFLYPLASQLAEKMDVRPVRTLVQTVEAMIAFRDRSQGLLLSELGDALDGMGAGHGGTKRLGTLIRHRRWQAEEIDEFLWQRADQQVQQWEEQGQEGLVIWDGSVWEKPESLAAEGLCAVRSSKGGRLTHVKKGYYHPPGVPIFVPGMHGIALLLTGRQRRQGPGQVLAVRWWTSRGGLASYEKDENCKLLRHCSQQWGRQLLHVFDQGYSGSPWLGALRGFDVRFDLRWKRGYQLLNEQGVKQAAWKIARGKVGLAPRTIWDAVHHRNVEGRVLFFPVRHPDYPDWPLTLVVGRRKGGEPWYLLTNEPVETAEDAWRIVLAYARRWRVEMLFRNLKSELAIQSVRVSRWEDRLKLLGLVTLAYAFLMDLMAQPHRRARDWLLDYVCHRTGRHLQDVGLPFSRMRLALSKLWLAWPCWFVRRGKLML